MSEFTFPVVIEHDEDGYFAHCPSLQGCHAQGATYEAALANLKDAVQLHIEDRIELGEPIPVRGSISFTTLQVSA